MAQLSKILGSVLRDIVSAQHEANMYALKLSSAYRDYNQAIAFNPPAVCIGDVELMLHCGFSGISVNETNTELDQTAVLRTIQELSSDISEVVITSILSTIIRHSDKYCEGEGPIARLNKEKVLRRNFIAFMSRELHSYLKGSRAEFIAIDGSIDMEKLQESILLVANDKFMTHSDLEELFSENGSGDLKKTIKEDLQTNIQIMLPRLLKDVQLARPSRYSSIDVTVSSDELSKLPDECIQTFRLKISPRDFPTDTD